MNIMNKTLLLTLVSILGIYSVNAQNNQTSEKHGKTLNLGLGAGGYSGYYGYIGRTLPVFHLNYEFDATKNFTIAPFITFYTYTNSYYWGDKNNQHRYYSYRETVVPVGVKGTYYFDKLLGAGPRWDFYLAGSLGFAVVNSRWESGYEGDKKYYHSGNRLFLDAHIGAEYHINKRTGLFLDLSNGVSTIGIALH